eukprot:9188210-Prorocentrum_lima.AAC.1
MDEEPLESVDCPRWHLSEAVCRFVHDLPVAIGIRVHSAARSDAVPTRWARQLGRGEAAAELPAGGDGAP